MKCSITIPVATRPKVLHNVLSSLYTNRYLNEFDLIIGLEPILNETAWICKNIPQGIFKSVTIIQNNCRMGVSANPFNLLDTTFDRGYDFTIHIEDDIFSAKDVTTLAFKYAKSKICKEVGCFCLFGPKSVQNPIYIGKKEIFYTSHHFIPWGLVITKQNWTTHLQPNWFRDNRGWDYGVLAGSTESQVQFLHPDKNRTRHLYIGTHVPIKLQTELFDIADFYDGDPLEEYNLESNQSL